MTEPSKRKRLSPPAVGGSSLLVIFAVLCLVTFALLAISSAMADKGLSDRSLATVEANYLADAEAEDTLAQLRKGDVPEGVTVEDVEGGKRAFWTTPASKSVDLEVSVLFRGGLGSDYTIESWRFRPNVQADLNQDVDVFDGSGLENANG